MISIEPKKKVAPAFLPYICALMYLVIAVFVVVTCVTLIKGSLNISVPIIAIVLFIILFILSKVFSWYKVAEIRKNNNFVTYEVTDIIGVLGRNVTKYHILECSKYEKKGSTLILYGDIEKFEPMQKGKHIKKVKILDSTEGIEDIIKTLYKL